MLENSAQKGWLKFEWLQKTDCTAVLNCHTSLHLHSLILPAHTDSGQGHVSYFSQWGSSKFEKGLVHFGLLSWNSPFQWAPVQVACWRMKPCETQLNCSIWGLLTCQFPVCPPADCPCPNAVLALIQQNLVQINQSVQPALYVWEMISGCCFKTLSFGVVCYW